MSPISKVVGGAGRWGWPSVHHTPTSRLGAPVNFNGSAVGSPCPRTTGPRPPPGRCLRYYLSPSSNVEFTKIGYKVPGWQLRLGPGKGREIPPHSKSRRMRSVTRHEVRTARRANMTKVVGLAGMAAAAATLAMTVGAGTAGARPPHPGPSPHDNSSPSATSSPSGATAPQAAANASLTPSQIYNPGPGRLGFVNNPGPIVVPASPTGPPLIHVPGVQLPVWWQVNGTPTRAPF
jgi:hypothetical protein